MKQLLLRFCSCCLICLFFAFSLFACQSDSAVAPPPSDTGEADNGSSPTDPSDGSHTENGENQDKGENPEGTETPGEGEAPGDSQTPEEGETPPSGITEGTDDNAGDFGEYIPFE